MGHKQKKRAGKENQKTYAKQNSVEKSILACCIA